MRGGRLVVAVALGLAAASCLPIVRPAVGPPVLERLDEPPALLDDGDPVSLAAAIRQSLGYFERLPADRAVAFGSQAVTAAEMRAGLRELLALVEQDASAAAIAALLAERFVVYRATAPEGILFTGYYVPTLDARAAADEVFRHPVLGRPPDLVTASAPALDPECQCTRPLVGRVRGGVLEPYFTRAEIERGASADAPVLAWVDDPVALFFLQIQGSGLLRFPDGRQQSIGFAASNGRPYTSVGRVLIDSGRLARSEASMQGIQRWAAAHPDERDAILHRNERYVFFRPLDGPAVGSLGVPVTGGRSIATDAAFYPRGALAFVRLPPELTPGASRGPLARIALNQDSGAAIRGPGRVDLFFGAGADAGALAGRLKAHGTLYFLAPRPRG